MSRRGPYPLFSTRGRLDSRIERELGSSQRLSLFLDYDGTLTPIAPTPEDAVLSARAANILKVLARTPGLRVAIVSGRSLEQIRRTIPRMSITIAANHGLQIAHGGRIWTHPFALRCIPVLAAVRTSLERKLRRISGIRLEDKGVVLTVHLRHVGRDDQPAVKSAVREVTKPFYAMLRLTTGKMVLEVRPAVDWDKGDAILRLLSLRRKGLSFPLFIGDDRTDEDGFAALDGMGLTIRVGRSQRTRAQYYASGVNEVLDFLEAMAHGRHR
jgi:trehalose 6-phosphate phosphatase